MLQFKHEDKSYEFDGDRITIHEALKSLGLDSKKVIAANFNGQPYEPSKRPEAKRRFPVQDILSHSCLETIDAG